MLLSLVMPTLGEFASAGRMQQIFVREGDELVRGAPIFELKVDLSAAAPQECPPVFYLRVVAREVGWVRRIEAAAGELYEPGTPLALVTVGREDPLEGRASRRFRTAQVTVQPESMFT